MSETGSLKPDADAQEGAHKESSPKSDCFRLFIADDNRDFCRFVAEVAELEGWAVTVCENGRALVDRLHEGEQPDLVFLDLLMPEMDGIETIKHLNGLERLVRIRFMTGGAFSNAVAAEHIAASQGLELGETIQKPISLKALRKIFQEELAAAKTIRA